MPDQPASNPVELKSNPNRVQLTRRGLCFPNTKRAITLRVKGRADVQYIPTADVDMTYLQRTKHRTHRPHTGVASYYALTSHAHRNANAVWIYEDSMPADSNERRLRRILCEDPRAHPIEGLIGLDWEAAEAMEICALAWPRAATATGVHGR